MPRYGNEERFTQTWYSNPPYPRTIEEVEASFPFFAERAAHLVSLYPNATKIGVAGAGFGAIMYYLYFTHGKDPWGFDIAWAANQGAGTLKAASNRLIAADALVAADMERFRRAMMGGNRNTKIPLILTEDMLPCAETEAEVQTMLTNLRAVGTQLVHIISPLDTTTTQTEDMLWRTPSQWRQIIGPNEPILLPSLVEVP